MDVQKVEKLAESKMFCLYDMFQFQTSIQLQNENLVNFDQNGPPYNNMFHILLYLVVI